MIIRAKQLVRGIAMVIMALCALAGCAALGEPSSTEDLLVRFAANPNNLNFVGRGKADLSLSLAGYRATVPIEGTAQVADDRALFNVSVDLSSFAGETREYEVYVETVGTNALWYLRNVKSAKEATSVLKEMQKESEQTADSSSGANDQSESSPWNKAEIDISFDVDIPLIVEILSKAKFMRASYASDDQICYDLTILAKDVLHALLSKGEITTSFYEVNEEELANALGDSKLHVCFNKDCLVRTLSLDLSFTYDDKETIPLPVRVGLEMDATLDGYGTVDPAKITVTDSVRNAAAGTEDPFDVDGLADKLQSSAA
ncbi:MAG: hypothetical protein Q4B54_01955 [Coriobacteriales bacterium]|nr:hypothetical protein [Coriobacteriales bacterium]